MTTAPTLRARMPDPHPVAVIEPALRVAVERVAAMLTAEQREDVVDLIDHMAVIDIRMPHADLRIS